METKKETKKEVVRRVLQEIGAVFANPSGWKEKVIAEIAKREGTDDDKKIHPVSIYTYRKELINELGGSKKESSAVAKNRKVQSVQSIDFAKLQKISEFAKLIRRNTP